MVSNKVADPLLGVLHAQFFPVHVAQVDHGFGSALLDGIPDVGENRPLDDLAGDDYIHPLLQGFDDLDTVFRGAAVGVPGAEGHGVQVTHQSQGAYLGLRVADEADTVHADGVHQVAAQAAQGGFGDVHDEMGEGAGFLVNLGMGFPAQIFQHAGKDAVGVVEVHVVVVPPDGDAVVVQQLPLFLVDRVGEILKPACLVSGGVEDGFVSIFVFP